MPLILPHSTSRSAGWVDRDTGRHPEGRRPLQTELFLTGVDRSGVPAPARHPRSVGRRTPGASRHRPRLRHHRRPAPDGQGAGAADVGSLIPKSCATSGIDFPVSVTIRAAPSRNSAVNTRRFSAMTLNFPCSHGLHATREVSERPPDHQPGAGTAEPFGWAKHSALHRRGRFQPRI